MRNRHKVIIVSGVFLPEPVVSARLNYDMAERLSDRYDVTVISPRPSRPFGAEYRDAKPIEGGFKHIIVDSYTCPKSNVIGRLRESYSFARSTLRYIKQNGLKADFIYNCSWHLIGLFMIARYAIKNNIPYIVPVQDIYPESLLAKLKHRPIVSKIIRTFALPIDRYYLSNAACVRTISDDMANYLSETRNIPRERFLIVNNWQEDSIFDKKCPNKLNGRVKFSYVGSVNDSSNVEYIIKSYSQTKLIESLLCIYGSGSNRQSCEDLVKSLDLEKQVLFDSVEPHQVPEVEWNSNVLVLALKEGVAKTALPSKLTAYCLAGRPVIASLDEDSAAARIIKQYDFGVVVPPDNEAKLMEAFALFAKMDESELQRLGNNARLCAEELFMKDVNIRKIIEKVSLIID